MDRLTKKRRHGQAYDYKPWLVVIEKDDSNNEEHHQFRTEEEADEFIAEYGRTEVSSAEEE